MSRLMWLGKRLQYQHVGTFKGVLFLAAVMVIVSMLVYTQVLVDQLKNSTRQNLQHKIRLYSVLVNSEYPELIALALEQIQAVDFPIIVTDAQGNPKHWKNVDVAVDDTSTAARTRLRRLIAVLGRDGNEPLPVLIGENQVDLFHYGDSTVIRQLRWLPWIEIVVAVLFVIVGYM
ncbi:MAG: hypothetical protein PHI18_08820, partial [bacterium]|nr:hypothetical protein [bacterium]